MAAPKRTAFEIEQHRAQITQLYLRRLAQHEIAQALGISRAMVAYDLSVIQQQWRKDTARDLDADKADALARIDELERTYWQAWAASQEDKEVTVQEQGTGGTGGNRAKAQVRKEGQSGNPTFLAGVMTCIDRRCKLLGLDAPVKQEVTGADGGPITISAVSAAREAVLSRLTLLAERERPQLPASGTDG
jgi:hypothetical protein